MFSANSYRFIRNKIYYRYLLYPYALLKHRRTDRDTPKSNIHTYTSFCRSPGQIEVLTGAVTDFILGVPRDYSRKITINIVAGSNGLEAYTVASALLNLVPELDFHIYCSDLHDHMVEYARVGAYNESEVLSFDTPESFIDQTFDVVQGKYIVKKNIKDHITFFSSDIITDDLNNLYPKADIIFVQNVLFHLKPEEAYQAFSNVMTTASERCIIFMDGVFIPMRLKLINQYHLKPVKQNIKSIHEYARRHIPKDWWNYYYGLEPYLFFMPKKAKRYGTVFKYLSR